MKQLKKVQLLDAKELTPKQMKDIKGGAPTSGSECTVFDCNQDQYCTIHIGSRPYSGKCVSGTTCFCDTMESN